MRKLSLILILNMFIFGKLFAGSWCKVLYGTEMTEGELQEQISKCRNSDNFFLAIHSSYSNAGNLLNGFTAELCNLNRRVITKSPNDKDPFFSLVCEYKKNFLRK